MVNGCQTGFRLFLITSVLWQMVNLETQKGNTAIRWRHFGWKQLQLMEDIWISLKWFLSTLIITFTVIWKCSLGQRHLSGWVFLISLKHSENQLKKMFSMRQKKERGLTSVVVSEILATVSKNLLALFPTDRQEAFRLLMGLDPTETSAGRSEVAVINKGWAVSEEQHISLNWKKSQMDYWRGLLRTYPGPRGQGVRRQGQSLLNER